MTVTPLPSDPRLTALLADAATEGLDKAASSELDRLLNQYRSVDADELARPAAALQIAAMRRSGRIEAMPDSVRQSLNESADRFFAANADANVVEIQHRQTPPEKRTGTFQVPPWTGWAAAAGLLVALIVVNAPDLQNSPQAPAQRAALIAAEDAIVLPWSRSEEPGYEQVSGDVVWSDSRQEGYMRFSGLAANDPANAQYQLWIIDPDRDARPVDGGVFDVPAGAAEVIVTIDAKLAIARPTAFAVTLEKPGGVVVSDGPLLIVAPAG